MRGGGEHEKQSSWIAWERSTIWVDDCRIIARKQELEASPSLDSSLDSSLQSSDQPGTERQSHMGSDLIGAVHVQGPLSHLPSHMQRQISHSPSPSQSPEGMGVMQIDGTGGVKGGFAGGTGFGVTPYADAEALSKLRGHPAWETQVFILSFIDAFIFCSTCRFPQGQVCTVLSSCLCDALIGRQDMPASYDLRQKAQHREIYL